MLTGAEIRLSTNTRTRAANNQPTAASAVRDSSALPASPPLQIHGKQLSHMTKRADRVDLITEHSLFYWECRAPAQDP